MAPEEWQRGAQIDQITNVYTLGRTAFELLGFCRMENWKGMEAMRAVAERAASPERSARHRSVIEFVKDWRSAVEGVERCLLVK
jgi:serine/threonine-protein kinase